MIVEIEPFRFTTGDRRLYCGEFGERQSDPIDLAAAPAVIELAPLVSMIHHCGE